MNPTDTPLLVPDGLAAIVKSPGGTMTSAPGAITRLTGSSSAAPQVLNVGAGLVYGNVEINKATATDRVTLSSNVADANIIGNLTVNTGILNTGGFGIVGAGSTFEVKAGASFELAGTSLPTATFHNLSLANTGAGPDNRLLLPAASGHVLTVTNAYSQSSGYFDVRQNTLVGPAALTMSGGRLYLGRAGSGVVQPEFTGPYALSGGTIILSGGGAQAVRGVTFASLTLAGTGPKTLAAPASAQDSLFLNGNQRTKLAGHLFTLGSSPIHPGTLARGHALSAEYTYGGSFRRWLPAAAQPNALLDAALFPVGTAAFTRPFYAAAPTAPTAGGTLTVTHQPAAGTSPPTPPFSDGGQPIVATTNMAWNVLAGDGLAGGQYVVRAGGEGIPGIGNVNDLRLVQAAGAVGTAAVNGGTPAFPFVNRQLANPAELSQLFRYGTVGGISPLPVELSAFDVAANGPAALLRWTTATEKNASYFEVQRSVDGRRFVAIGRVAAGGSSSSPRAYAYVDAAAAQAGALLYYRLYQLDFDGAATYSPVRTISFGAAAAAGPASFGLYPNPARTATTARLRDVPAGRYQLCLLDALGRVLRQQPCAGGAEASAALDVAALPVGTYLLRLSGTAANGQPPHLNQRLLKE